MSDDLVRKLRVLEEDYREADRYLRRAAGCPELMDPWDGKFGR